MGSNRMTELNKLMVDLETNELESSTGVLSATSYTQLLAIYLYRNELCQAKFLWKRIPQTVKSSHPELERVWQIGQSMWKRHWAQVHTDLKQEWSEDIKEIMEVLKDMLHERIMRLIAKAYSSLDLTAMATMCGLSLEEAKQAAINRGWSVDGAIVQPRIEKRSDEDEEQYQSEMSKLCLTEEQLQKLTQFVSFLEN